MSGAGTPGASLRPASEKARGSAPKRRGDGGGSGRSGRSKIESDCCESGRLGDDEGVRRTARGVRARMQTEPPAAAARGETPRRSNRLGRAGGGRRRLLRLTGQGRARLDRAEFGRPGLARCFDELTRRFSLDLADRFLEREALAGDVGLVERRRDPAQLRKQGGTRPFVERTAVLAVVLFETGDGAGDQWIIIGHRSLLVACAKCRPCLVT